LHFCPELALDLGLLPPVFDKPSLVPAPYKCSKQTSLLLWFSLSYDRTSHSCHCQAIKWDQKLICRCTQLVATYA
jgi:hypothetical protein